MGWDGAGGYDRQFSFSADASADIKILASRIDTELDDFASALTNTLARDGQNEPSANLPMGGFRFQNVGQAASAEDFLRVREFISDVPIFVRDGNAGGIDQISASVTFYATTSSNQAPPDGARLRVISENDKTGSSVTIRLHTPLGIHTGDVLAPRGNEETRAVHGREIKGRFPHDYIWSSADDGWLLQNRYNGTQTFVAAVKGYNALGTVTGVASANGAFTINGDQITVGIGDINASFGLEVSVSVSASTRYIAVSGLPGLTEITPNRSQDILIVQRASGNTNILCHTVFRGSAVPSVYRIVPIGAVFSADETFIVPGHTVTFLT